MTNADRIICSVDTPITNLNTPTVYTSGENDKATPDMH